MALMVLKIFQNPRSSSGPGFLRLLISLSDLSGTIAILDKKEPNGGPSPQGQLGRRLRPCTSSSLDRPSARPELGKRFKPKKAQGAGGLAAFWP